MKDCTKDFSCSKHAIAATSLFPEPKTAEHVGRNGRFTIPLRRCLCDAAKRILTSYRSPQPEPFRAYIVALWSAVFPSAATCKWT